MASLVSLHLPPGTIDTLHLLSTDFLLDLSSECLLASRAFYCYDLDFYSIYPVGQHSQIYPVRRKLVVLVYTR